MDTNLIVGVLTLIGTIAITLYVARRYGSPKNEKQETKKPVVVGKIVKLITGPRLAVSIKDISCYTRPTTEHTPQVGVSDRHFIEWWVECFVEIKNKSRQTTPQIAGSMELKLGKGHEVLSLKSRKSIHTPSLTKSAVHRVKIVFPAQKFQLEEGAYFQFYPDAPYRLDYIYSYSENTDTSTRKSTVKGRLTKVDWVKRYVIKGAQIDEFGVSIVRASGFKDQ